jgi:hypothetical protein
MERERSKLAKVTVATLLQIATITTGWDRTIADRKQKALQTHQSKQHIDFTA